MDTTTATYDYNQFNTFDENGIQTCFTCGGLGKYYPETREDRITRWIEMGIVDPECSMCQEKLAHPRLSWRGPNHKASPRCQSGGRPHCTCDTCF